MKSIRQLEAEGVFVNIGSGRSKRYVLCDAIRSWGGWKSDSAKRLLAGTNPERADVDFERARKLKLENDAREAILIEQSHAIGAIDFIVGILQTELAGIPPRLSDDPEMRRRLETEIDAVLGAIAGRFDQAGAALRAGSDPREADDQAYGVRV